MFKSLLRTLPVLSGNVKMECNIKPDVNIPRGTNRYDDVTCHVCSVSLYPISSSIGQSGIKVRMLSDTYDWNLKDFYSIYKDAFYSSQYKYDKDEIERIDYTKETEERDKAFEFGLSRSKYSVSGTQFEFFAPIYVDNVDDIPDEFVITLSVDNGIYKVKNKKLHIRLRDTITDNNGNVIDLTTSTKSTILQYNKNKMFDYLYRYIYNINSSGLFSKFIQFNYNEQSKELNDSNAIYYGIDLIRGGYTSAVDTPVNSLYYNALTINSFDDIVTRGFSRHNMAMWQIIPLCFSFNIEDMMTKDELKLTNFSKITFSGRYVFDNEPYDAENVNGDLYDFSLNYSDYYIPSFIYNKKECKSTNSVIYGDDTDNVMNQSFPALNEKRYWKYRFMNKIKPNTTRWIMQQSQNGISNSNDKFPYIINNNIAFSICNNSSFKYFPIPHSELVKNNIVSNVYTITPKINSEYSTEYSNLVIPNSKTTAVETDDEDNATDSKYYIRNYEYYKYFNSSDTEWLDGGTNEVYTKYIDSVKSNGNILSNVLYLTNDFYNKKIEGETTIMDYICDINNDVSLNEVINGTSVFEGSEISSSPTHFLDIFDKKNDDYCKLWSTPVKNSAWYNDCLFDFNILYNKELNTSQLQKEYNTAVLNPNSTEALTASEVASTNCIYDYINDKSFDNFKKTKKITKFGVFTLPVVSIIENGQNISSADNVVRFGTAMSDDKIASYSNLLHASVYGDLYDVEKVSDGSKTFNVSMDEPSLYVKKKLNFNLYDIMLCDGNIAYTRVSDRTNRVSYTMSATFTQNKSYSNLYVSSYELINNINNNLLRYTDEDNTQIFPYGTDLNMCDTNMYFSYTELCTAYNNVGDDSTRKGVLYELMCCDKITSYSFVNVANLDKLTVGKSNKLAYEWTKTAEEQTGQKTLSYLYNIIYADNTTENVFNDILITDGSDSSKSSALIDAGISYVEDAHFTLYSKTLYNKDEFVSAAYWLKTSKYATDYYRKQLCSYVSEYKFVPKYKNFNNNTIFTNIMSPVTTESSSKYNGHIENIKLDDNVLWVDTFNMYNVLTKYGLMERGMTDDKIEKKCNEWKSNNIIKELFYSFINKKNLILSLSTLFLGMSNTAPLYEVTKGTGVEFWNKDKYKRYSTDANKGEISFNINSFSAYYKTTYKTDKAETHYIGGPFHNLFVCEKTVVVDGDNVRLRPKYKYIRFGKYIEDTLTKYIKENAKKDWLEPSYEVDEIDVEKTVENMLKRINYNYLSYYIEETNTEGVFNLQLHFDVYKAGTESQIISKDSIQFTLKNMLLMFKKEFIRVDEHIMEEVFKLSDEQKDVDNIDLYFVSPLYDTAFDRKMYNVSLLYNIIENEKYNDELNNYATSPYVDGNLPIYYNDIMYRQSDIDNYTPLYNYIYIQDKEATSVYIQSTLNNIKKCVTNYGEASPFKSVNSTTNYRYNTSDLNTLIKVNTDMLNQILDMLNLNVLDKYNNYDIYKKVFEKSLKDITLYSDYSQDKRYLLSPEAGGKYDSLGFAPQNMFTFTKDGENYGFYVVGVLCDNTKASFKGITSIKTVKLEKTDDDEYKITFSGVNNNNKLFQSVDGVRLINVDTTTGEQTISIDGVQYYCSSINKIIPYIKENILKNILNVDTLIEQKTTKQSMRYYTSDLDVNEVFEKNIGFTASKSNINSINDINPIRNQQLQRYWTYASPCFEEVSEMQKNGVFNYIYNTKRKNDDGTLIKTGKYPSIGDFVLDQTETSSTERYNGSTVNDINKYTGINIYSTPHDIGISSYNNKTIKNHKETEYKHFNVSTFFQLPSEFVITDNKRYIYNDILEKSTDAKKKQIFKNYVYHYVNNKYRTNVDYTDEFISDTDILFLYSRYNVKIESNSVGLNNKNERVYTLVYRFCLK